MSTRMMTKITDLDRFSLEQIWRPYQNMVGYERLTAPPLSLEETAVKLAEDTDWSRRVLDRIKAVGFTIPTYIRHPLADIVRRTCGEPAVEAPASPAISPSAPILKGTCHTSGDGWKDTAKKGDVVFVWNAEHPAPYAPGQFPRLGNPIYAASTDSFDFVPATVDDVRELIDAALSAVQQSAPIVPVAGPYQDRVAAAHHALFHDDPTDVAERLARYAEETNEVLQAFGMSREDMHRLVDYTCDRPAGEPKKEIGAALLTLTSLCVVAGYDLMACGEANLEKLQVPETIARIRAKRSTRHGRGPLPGVDPVVPHSSLNGEAPL